MGTSFGQGGSCEVPVVEESEALLLSKRVGMSEGQRVAVKGALGPCFRRGVGGKTPSFARGRVYPWRTPVPPSVVPGVFGESRVLDPPGRFPGSRSRGVYGRGPPGPPHLRPARHDVADDRYHDLVVGADPDRTYMVPTLPAPIHTPLCRSSPAPSPEDRPLCLEVTSTR